MANNRVIHRSKADVDAAKVEVEARCVKATVTGELPVRDSVTREDVEKGGTVRLDPTTILLDPLIAAGNIRLDS